MRAILCNGSGGPEVMAPGEVPPPAPDAGEVLIRVAASAVNRADLAQRSGSYPPPPGESEILGLEVSGRIEALGEGVETARVGDRVMTLVGGGAYAEFTTAPACTLMPVPDRFDLVTAGAIPEVFLTAYLNVFREAALRQGEIVLIHGGASGVGTAGIQLCRRLRDATVIVTVGSDDKAEACRALGADLAIVYKREDFADRVKDATEKHGADVILDHIGGGYLADNLRCLATNGRLVIIGVMGGSKAELNVGQLMVRRQRIIGSVLRARSVAEKAELTRAFRAEVWPLLDDGRLEPVIHTRVPLAEAAEAHRLVGANANTGKVLLVVDEGLD
ncbi:MAG: NAD(P)H-quinone oxidoreductase [Pseudomonadota bacterium]